MLKKEVLIEPNTNLHANVGEHIGYELGAKFIKDYYDKYQEAGSHFVGRNIVEKILAQPGCIGINIYKALDENGNKTYVFTGVNEEGKPMLELTAVNTEGKIEKIEGLISDRKENTGWFDGNIF